MDGRTDSDLYVWQFYIRSNTTMQLGGCYIFVIITSSVYVREYKNKKKSHWKNINQQHLLTINHLNVLSISNFWHGHISSNENDLSNLSSAASIYVRPIIYVIIIRTINSWPANCNFLLFSCAMKYFMLRI